MRNNGTLTLVCTFFVQMSFVLHQVVLEDKFSSLRNYAFYVSVNKGTQQIRKIKTWFQVKIKYHMNNSSGGKLSFHGQLAPVNLTPNCYRCTKREWLIAPAFTQMKLVLVHYVQVSWFAYCHAAPYYCFILHILNKTVHDRQIGAFRNIVEAIN